MAPPASAGATARRATAAPQPRPSSRRRLSRRGHLWLAALLVVGSLLCVVVGDIVVAQGQVRMANLQSQIASQQAIQKAAQTQVAQLAAPDRVVQQGIALGLTAPGQVHDLPQVPLDVPLPVPDTAPLPGTHAATTATPTAPAAATTPKAAATTPTAAAR